MQLKIGIYVRVSSEEQAQVVEGSIDSQQHRIRGFVDIKNLQDKNWGKVVETYIDEGFSAKSTKRPAYQRMLKDVRSGKINLILVTDLSRLSRNIADFCGLLKDLENYKAKFLSIKEQFDTSTPAGEMMIFNMINLAQFERKQTSERVAMNFHARAVRGLANGGQPLLGYDTDPANPGRKIVNEEEKETVEYIFNVYLEEGSLSKTASRLNKEGIRRKVTGAKKQWRLMKGTWSISTVQDLIRNMTYIGKREINKTNKNLEQVELKAWQRYQVVEATWPAIISEEVFYKVQNVREHAKTLERSRLNSGTRRFFPYSGVSYCGECGRAMIGHSAHGRSQIYRYYGHKKEVGDVITCSVERILADEFEAIVFEYLNKILFEAGRLGEIEKNLESVANANNKTSKDSRKKLNELLESIKMEIDSVFKLLGSSNIGEGGKGLIHERIEALATKKKELETKLENIGVSELKVMEVAVARKGIENRVAEFQQGWKKASPSIRKRLIRGVFDAIVFTKEGLKVFFVTEQINEIDKNGPKTKKPLTDKVSGFLSSLGKPIDTLVFTGSPIVVHGGSDRT